MTKRVAPDTPLAAAYTPNPLYMGAFADCPNEIIAQIIARVFSSGNFFTAIVKNVSLVCKAFQWICNHRSTFDFYLDNELKEKTAFIFQDFVSYQTLFKRKYQGTLTQREIFARYPQLTCLEVSNQPMEDDVMAMLIHETVKAGCQLQSLKLKNCPITKLDLSELKSLKKLRLDNCSQLSENLDFTGLDQMQSLTVVECRRLSGFSPLNQLKHLKTLEVKMCDRLRGSLPVKDLTQLSTLRWGGNAGASLDLKGFSQLEILDLSNCDNIAELLGLNELKLLKVFRLNAYIGPLQQLDLDGLDQLEHLDLKDALRLKALLGLSSLSRLKKLELAGCKQLPEELDLEGLDQLEVLILTDCKQLTKLRNISKLLHLKEIDARSCDRLIIDPSELPPGVHVQIEEVSSEDEDSDQPPTP